MLDAFQEDGELSLKKFPELAQLRQAVKFLALDLGTKPGFNNPAGFNN